MDGIFIQLAVILFTAFIVAYIARALNQPIMIGYIVAGILLSPFLIKLGASTEIINTFSEIGISFLLFIVGLHLNPKVIKEIGVSSLVIGLIQIVLTFGATFLISKYILASSTMTSLFFGIALSFSSTIIIMKLLSDKRQIDSLTGKISIGILIIQDLVAAGVLMFISSVSGPISKEILGIQGVLAGSVLLILLFIIGYFLIPRILGKIAKSQELLFLFSLCWCFVLAAVFSYVGFSMEIGSLLAGVILSISPYATEISSKIRPLRDFFLIIFFIILGLKIQISEFSKIIIGALVLSGITLFLKPAIIYTSMKIFNYTKRTKFIVSSTMGQISEFSVIILGMGLAAENITTSDLSTIVLTLVLTILVSSYLIEYSERIYFKISNFGDFFKDKKRHFNKKDQDYDVLLFGYNRIGYSILNSLKKLKKRYLVVDYNPDTINKLKRIKIPALYGDVYDISLLEELPLEKIKLAVSTIPELEGNKILIQTIREYNSRAIVILRAHTIKDALDLYNMGADYVLTPHFLGGEYVAKMIKHSKPTKKDYHYEKKKHIESLREIMKMGKNRP